MFGEYVTYDVIFWSTKFQVFRKLFDFLSTFSLMRAKIWKLAQAVLDTSPRRIANFLLLSWFLVEKSFTVYKPLQKKTMLFGSCFDWVFGFSLKAPFLACFDLWLSQYLSSFVSMIRTIAMTMWCRLTCGVHGSILGHNQHIAHLLGKRNLRLSFTLI